MARQKHLAVVAASAPLKLDFGCGPNKQEGFHGVDIQSFKGADTILDVRKTPWPWADDSVDEAYSSHFVEHLTGAERVGFWNELYRVMKVGAQARIIVPNWSHACAYGDPTHQWPPMSMWFLLYLNKGWRDGNAPHVGLACDFDFTSGPGIDANVPARPLSRNDEFKTFACEHYTNVHRDIHSVLTKRAPEQPSK